MTPPLVWVHVSPMRELPYCALREVYPGGRVYFHCGDHVGYGPLYVATGRVPGMECRACMRELGLQEVGR